HATGTIIQPKTASAAIANQPPTAASHGIGASSAPATDSGVTMALTTGIAIAFAIGELSETMWNCKASSGTSATEITICSRVALRRLSIHRCLEGWRHRPAPASISTATAPNDSQNPGANGAQG